VHKPAFHPLVTAVYNDEGWRPKEEQNPRQKLRRDLRKVGELK
jgi:hypothetical protein